MPGSCVAMLLRLLTKAGCNQGWLPAAHRPYIRVGTACENKFGSRSDSSLASLSSQVHSLSTVSSRADQRSQGRPQLTCQCAPPRLCLQNSRWRELSAASSPGCQASKHPLDVPPCMVCRLPVDALSNRPSCTGSHRGASLPQLIGLQVAVSSIEV